MKLFHNPLVRLLTTGALFLGSLTSCTTLKTAEKPVQTQIQEQGEKYAIIVSDTTETEWKNDTVFAYQVLLERGFKKENIHIFDYDGTETKLYPATGICVKENIEWAINKVSKDPRKKDFLFVYFATHGPPAEDDPIKEDGNYSDSRALLKEGSINEKELEQMLEKVNSKKILIFIDSCRGGGFAKRFSRGNYIGISSSDRNSNAWMIELNSDREDGWMNKPTTFGRQFMKAFIDQENSDINKDGMVSINEAFDYAIINHKTNHEQYPQIKSELDTDNISL